MFDLHREELFVLEVCGLSLCPKDGDVVGVAAEAGDVLVHPLQGHHLIHES